MAPSFATTGLRSDYANEAKFSDASETLRLEDVIVVLSAVGGFVFEH